jgi:TRAP-type C4-dicarboxylate transport system substrate-binding protein
MLMIDGDVVLELIRVRLSSPMASVVAQYDAQYRALCRSQYKACCRSAALFVMLLMVAPAQASQWAVVGQSSPDSVAADSVRAYAAAVTKMSGGSLKLTAQAMAANTSAAQLLTDVAAGRIALASVPLAALEASDPVVAMDRVPYLASNFVDGAKLWQVLHPYVRDTLHSKGITLLYAVPAPPPSPVSRKPLTQMSAWRGSSLVLNAPALRGFARALGTKIVANAVPRDLLGTSRAEVVFQSAPVSARDKAWEYATDLLLAPAWFPKQLVVASTRQLAALGAADRDVLFNAADAARSQAWISAERATVDAVQKLRDYGIKTRKPPVGVLIKLEALGRELLFQWSDGAGEAGAKLVGSYYAIR